MKIFAQSCVAPKSGSRDYVRAVSRRCFPNSESFRRTRSLEHVASLSLYSSAIELASQTLCGGGPRWGSDYVKDMVGALKEVVMVTITVKCRFCQSESLQKLGQFVRKNLRSPNVLSATSQDFICFSTATISKGLGPSCFSENHSIVNRYPLSLSVTQDHCYVASPKIGIFCQFSVGSFQ